MIESQTHPITPDGLASPSPQCKGSVASEPPHCGLPHGIPETCVGKQVCGVGDLESQQVGLEPVGCGRVLLHAICDQVARVYDVLLAGLESDLVDLTFATQGKETTTSSVGVTPVGNALIQSALIRSNSSFILLPCWCSREATGSMCVRSKPTAHSSVSPSSPVFHRGAQ